MGDNIENQNRSGFNFPHAARFWERGRILYNAILTLIVLLWVVLTWPHFRPALTLGALEALVVLALAANLCYSAAYLADFFMQGLLSIQHWRRFRQVLWLLGMLFAILLENYWIADEIYDYVNQPPPELFQGANHMSTANIASNMNFPAPLAAVGFLAACASLFFVLASALIFWFARKPKFARLAVVVTAAGAVVYFALLFGYSAASHTTVLARGQEKYFCEIDCHLAYSVVNVKTETNGRYLITLRTRFDETTISPSRPKDAPLTPSPRDVRLVDDTGRKYTPAAIQGTPLLTPLKPADSYTTQLEFDVPKDANGLRLLLNTAPGWPDHVVIGDENSWLHKKTFFAL
ncbi:MAG: hypothetical protein ACLP6G_11180 [Terriglobales bacterium]